jgi:hypothetical protein
MIEATRVVWQKWQFPYPGISHRVFKCNINDISRPNVYGLCAELLSSTLSFLIVVFLWRSGMTDHAQGHRKHVSGERRERDVYLLYGAAFRDIPQLDHSGPNSGTYFLPDHHVPQPSQDSTLSALAQLATFRLGARRAMISLIDDQRQHILAEATTNMSIHPQTPGESASSLWLGSVSIPRTWASMRGIPKSHCQLSNTW